MAGAVLCGGASRRMGRDKALLAVHGAPMVMHVVSALSSAGCHPVQAIGGDRRALAALGLDVVDDGHPGEGPLGGVITALAASAESTLAVVVVACDLPQLTERTLRVVMAALGDADVAVARTDRLQPMCAVWRRTVLQPLRDAFDAGERRVESVLSRVKFVEVPVNRQDLANANTPGDLPQ